LAALLLGMAKIPVVSQEYHNGTYFHSRLWKLWSISTLILSSISCFTYSLHTRPSGLSPLQELAENQHFEDTLPPNGYPATMVTTPAAAMASHIANNPPALVGRPMVLPTSIGQPPTNQQRHLIHRVMAQKFGEFCCLGNFKLAQLHSLYSTPNLPLPHSKDGRRQVCCCAYLNNAVVWYLSCCCPTTTAYFKATPSGPKMDCSVFFQPFKVRSEWEKFGPKINIFADLLRCNGSLVVI
jgi:hypothetical protein